MSVRKLAAELKRAAWGVLVVAAFACEGTQREFPKGSLRSDSGGEPTSEVLPLGGRPGAAPQLATLGTSCSDVSSCASGYCVDGVCCDGACTDLCATCAAPGSEGVCSPAASDAACDASTCPGATECRGRDQTGLALNCEAVGKCRAALTCAPIEQPQGTLCQGGLGVCDGLGACLVAGKAALGAACALDGDCAEGNCVPGPGGASICCDAPCDGTCQACSAEGRCDAVPASDARCLAVACPADNACREYPAALTDNLCRGLGQCQSAQDCPATALQPAASCDCDATGACTLRRGVRCTASAECGAASACVANIAGETVCCAQACGEGLVCARDGSGCVECEGTEVSCEGQTAIHCEAGLRVADACPNGCTIGVGCNAQAPVGFSCTAAPCIAGAVCQDDIVGARRCCVRNCAAEGKECSPDGSCVCPAGQVSSGNGCSLEQGDPCGSGNAQCGAGLSCVDGVCCNEACTGACESCSAPGSIGTCTFAATDTGGCGTGERCVARNDCRAGNSQSCAQPADCVSNNCEPLIGVSGQSVCCAANCAAPQAFCTSDGTRCVQCQGNDCPNGCNVAQGVCFPPRALGEACNVAQQCGSGVCLPDVANAQINRCCPRCAAGQLCSAQGTCQNPPLGAGGPCQNDAQCSAGLFCRDGVCCTSACDRPCESCGGGGVCNVGVASDPQRCGAVTCTVAGNSCRTVTPPTAGQCAGLGQCAGSAQCNVQLRPQGTPCDGTGQCDGAGTCVQPVLRDNGQACARGELCSNMGQCLVHFSDPDNDGFAVVGAPQADFCVAGSFDQPNFTTIQPLGIDTIDCLEDNFDVRRGQTRFFTTGAPGKTTLPFDYNCDGFELSSNALLNRLQNCADTAVAVCESRGGYVPASSGVLGAVGIPACGQSGTFLPCANIPDQGGCVGSTGGPTPRQPCR